MDQNLEFLKDLLGSKTIDALAGPLLCQSGSSIPLDPSTPSGPPGSPAPSGPTSPFLQSPRPKRAIEETKNPTEMSPEVSQKDSPEKEADTVPDSETDSLKNPNMQTQNCNVVAEGSSLESLYELRRSQLLNKRSRPAGLRQKVKRYYGRNVHNKH